MKTYLLAFLFLAFCASAHAGITITTNASFGQKSKGCKGTGICKVETTKSEHMVEVEFGSGAAGSNQVSLVIGDDNAASLSPEVLANLGDGTFEQAEDFNLPAPIVAELGLNGGQYIEAGTYSVSHQSGKYTIRFTLKGGVANR